MAYQPLPEEEGLAPEPTRTQPQDTRVLFVLPYLHTHVTLLHLKYTAFLLCGTANLWPWNAFLSASEYFGDRLSGSPKLSDVYSSTMMTIWTLSSTLFNVYISQKQEGANYLKRLVSGSTIQVAVFSLMTFSVLLPRSWTLFYFAFIMINVAMSAIGACLSQVGLIAMVNVQGTLYANANVVGNAISGVLPSVSMILAVFWNSTQGGSRALEAVKYFLTSVAVTMLSLIFLGWMTVEEKDAETNTEEGEAEQDFEQRKYISFKQLWGTLKYVEITIALTFSITLAFAVFASTIESPSISKKVFTPLAFLVWNVGDLVGRIACAWPFFALKNQRRMVGYSALRIVFIPLFMGCNLKGRGTGWINDFFYILLQFLYGFTNGQLFSSSFMMTGQLLQSQDEKTAAAGYTALVINVSLLLGSVMSYFVVYMIG